jgi:Uma2 family endonuclease
VLGKGLSLKKTQSDMEAILETVSDYELERGKPMPNLTHGSVQINLGFELKLAYRTTHRIASEVTLATQPDGSTPDVLIYPLMPLGYGDEPTKRTDPPITCIEIQSPSQGLEVMVAKTHVYFAFGVQSCWVVLPSIQAVMVYDRPGHYQFFHGDETVIDPVTGIQVPLSGVFA